MTLTQDERKDWKFKYETNATSGDFVITNTYMLVSPEGKSTQAILIPALADHQGGSGERAMSFRDDSGSKKVRCTVSIYSVLPFFRYAV